MLGDTDATEQLAEQLYHTLYKVYLGLPDGTIVYPGHGHGSACGAGIGPRLETTIGYERATNPFLQHEGYDAFRSFVLGGTPEEPAHYSRLKKVNAHGQAILGTVDVPALPPDAFDSARKREGTVTIDTRHMLAFGGGHIPGALNIEDQPELSNWAGWLLDPDSDLLLVLKDDRALNHVLPLFTRVGFDRFAGYLVGGMTAWENAGLPLQRLPQLWVDDILESGDDVTVLDVRSPSEFEAGNIPESVHHFLGDMRDNLPELKENKRIAVYCGSGYRASLAASVLQAEGYSGIHNVPGSWKAWTNKDYPKATETAGSGS